jgi:hypothetical protein
VRVEDIKRACELMMLASLLTLGGVAAGLAFLSSLS